MMNGSNLGELKMLPLCEIIHGSHLYGLNTSQSDVDIKGVFVPNRKDILLQRAPKSTRSSTGNPHEKNQAGDIDTAYFSLHYFVELALKGEMIAFDMLHAPTEETTGIWDKLVSNREWFYNKNVYSYLGYVKKQAAKYGLKGTRLAELKKVYNIVNCHVEFIQNNKTACLADILTDLPEGKYVGTVRDRNANMFYEVLGSKHQVTIPLYEFFERVKSQYDKYGERVRLAEQNQGVDWKAVSHALRAGYQLKQLLTEGTMTFPIPNRDEVLAVKMGERDFLWCKNQMEELISEVQSLAKKSKLPEAPNREAAEDFVAEIYSKVT